MNDFVGLTRTAFNAVTSFFTEFYQTFFTFLQTIFGKIFQVVIFFAHTVSVISDFVASFFFETEHAVFGSTEFFLQFLFGFLAFFRTGFHTFAVQLFNIIHYILNVIQQAFLAGIEILLFHHYFLRLV